MRKNYSVHAPTRKRSAYRSNDSKCMHLRPQDATEQNPTPLLMQTPLKDCCNVGISHVDGVCMECACGIQDAAPSALRAL